MIMNLQNPTPFLIYQNKKNNNKAMFNLSKFKNSLQANFKGDNFLAIK